MEMGHFFYITLCALCYLTASCSGSQSVAKNGPNSNTCGITRVIKIVGGTAASEYYPWFVALVKPESRNSDQYHVSCGASLITPKHVLTAAHCYGDRPHKDDLLVVVNLANRCEKTGGKILEVSGLDVHKKFRMENPIPENDIALIYLKNEVSNMPICLPSRSRYSKKKGIIIGFGSTRMRSAYPCQMQYTEVEVMSRRNCVSKGNLQIPVADKTICAGVMTGGIDACDGDSGGPLMVNNGGVYELIGLVSYGDGCGRVKTPGIYTDITRRGFYDWIQDRLGDYKQTGGNTVADDEKEPTPTATPTSSESNTVSPVPVYGPTWPTMGLPRPDDTFTNGMQFFNSIEEMHNALMQRLQDTVLANQLLFS